MREAPPDPGAATEVPQERAKLPALPSSPREWVRSSWRRGGAGSDEDLRAVDELSDEVREPRGVDVRPVPAPTPTPPALVLVEDEPTDHGEGGRQAQEQRPYANLDYEERVCRLLEDLLDNTRRVRLRLDAEQHLRDVAATGDLDLQPAAPKGLREVMRDCIVAWLLDPEVKRLALKVAVVGTTAGGSVAGGASTMMLAMELVERLLRAWVQLP